MEELATKTIDVLRTIIRKLIPDVFVEWVTDKLLLRLERTEKKDGGQIASTERLQAPSNKAFIDKYWSQNGGAEKSIKNASYDNIVEESRRIAPIVSKVLRSIRTKISSETFTKLELQSHVIDKLEEYSLIPSMAGYHGFPAAIAISIDSELIHNIPENTVIQPGALVTVEVGASSTTAYASQAWSFLTSPIDEKKKNFTRRQSWP